MDCFKLVVFNFRERRSVMMTSLPFPARRSIAVLLSISFIWLFAACVSLCSMDCARIHQTAGRAWLHMPEDSQESDCCPVTKSPDAALSERWLFTQPKNSDQQSTLLILEHLLGQLRPPLTLRLVQYSSSSPPFDRLLTLRV
jgi:hypothetical protein